MHDLKETEFSALIKENHGIIFKISTIYSNNSDDQQDLYQEIVIQLWQSFAKFRKEAKLSTWIYRIALNTAISQLRRSSKRFQHVSITSGVLNKTEAVDPMFEERVKSLYQSIEQLNDLEKGIIFLFLENKSYEEIATITGLSITNVATRISRIKQKLRSEIKKA